MRIVTSAIVLAGCASAASPKATTAPAPCAPASVSAPAPSTTQPLPNTLAEARVEELRYLERLVGLWWAAKAEHERLDHVDVHARFEAAERSATSCKDDACYTELVRKTLCSLGDGHLRLEPEWWQGEKRYRTDFHLSATSDGIVVDAPGASLAKGERVTQVDGKPIEEALADLCFQPGSTPAQRLENGLNALSRRTLFGDGAPAPVKLRVRGNDDRERDVTVAFQPVDAKSAPSLCVEGRVLDPKRHVGLLDVRSFWCNGNTGAILDQTRNAAKVLGRVEHLIVDLRENGGGDDAPARFVASRLIGSRTEWMRYRHHRPFAEVSDKFFRDSIEPANDPDFSGWKNARLIVLIGPRCFSTCDTLASVLRGTEPHPEFFGQNTAGGVGNPTLFRLPYSGLNVSIPVTLYALPGSESDVLIEGRGVSPDHAIVPTRDDIVKGRDPVLEAAVSSTQRLR